MYSFRFQHEFMIYLLCVHVDCGAAAAGSPRQISLRENKVYLILSYLFYLRKPHISHRTSLALVWQPEMCLERNSNDIPADDGCVNSNYLNHFHCVTVCEGVSGVFTSCFAASKWPLMHV